MTTAHRPAATVGTPAGTRTTQTAAPRWMQLTSLALALAGLAISAYLTVSHYTAPTSLACPDTGLVNCAKVTTSPQSMLLGVPVALLGLLFYAGMTALSTPWAWWAASPLIRWARPGALAAGIAFVLYLVYTELFTLSAICLWCTAVHVITVALFALVAPTVAASADVPAGTSADPGRANSPGTDA